MTTDTLAKLAADLEQLASEGPALIHTKPWPQARAL